MRFERTIRAPRERVYEAFSDLGRWPERIEAITMIEPAEEGETLRFEEGVSFRETRVMFGKQHTETMTVRQPVAPERYTITSLSNGVAYSFEHVFEETPDGATTVRMLGATRATKLVPKLVGIVLGPILKGSMCKAIERDLDDMQRAIESESDQPPS